jgi:anti-anti-sigma factor
MIQWENRRLERVIGGDVRRDAQVRTANDHGVSDGWHEQANVRRVRPPLVCDASQPGRYEISGWLFGKLADEGTHDRVVQPASAGAVQTWRDDDAWLVVLTGELDLAVAETLRAALGQTIGEPPQRLIVDLSGLSFMDSSGVDTILDAYQQCRSAGPALTIRPGPPNVQQVFELTNTLDHLPFESNARGRTWPVT